MSYRPITPSNGTPTHQRLYSRASTPMSRPSNNNRIGRPSVVASNGRKTSRSVGAMRPSNAAGGASTSNYGGGSVASFMPPNSQSGRSRQLSTVVRHNAGGELVQHVPSVPKLYVADVNPTYCIDGAARHVETVNERVAWTAEYDGTLRIRSLPKGTPLKQLDGREGTFCSSLLYIEPYQRMWAAFHDGYIRVYDVATAKVVKEVVQHSGGINAMVMVEGVVYTGGVDWKICQWSQETATYERLFFGHNGAVRCLCTGVGPSGAVLFSGSDDSTIKAWNPYAALSADQNNADACMHTFTGHERAVLSLEMVPSFSQLWSGGEDGTVRVWNLENLQPVGILSGHTAPVSSLLAMESRMWSGDKHGAIQLWDIGSMAPISKISGRGARHGMVLTMKRVQPCSAWKVWTTGSAGTIQCWNVETVPILFDERGKAPTKRGISRDKAEEYEQYIRTLQDELDAARREAQLNYERDRMEVQRELETQQLLAEENDALKMRLREMEELAEDAASTGQRRAQSRQDDGQRQAERVRQLEQELRRAKQAIDQLEAAAQRQATAPSPSPAPEPAATPIAALLADPVTGEVPRAARSKHMRKLEDAGLGNWEYLLQNKPHELRQRAMEDMCAALGVPAGQVELALRPINGPQRSGEPLPADLQVEAVVMHPSKMPAEELERRMEVYGFPRMLDLYDRARGAPKTGLDAAEESLRQLRQQKQAEPVREEAAAAAAPTRADPIAARKLAEAQREVEQLRDANDSLAKDREDLRAEQRMLRKENDALMRLVPTNTPPPPPAAAAAAPKKRTKTASTNTEAEKVPAVVSAPRSASSPAPSSASARATRSAAGAPSAEDAQRQAAREASLMADVAAHKDTVAYYKTVIEEKEAERKKLEEALRRARGSTGSPSAGGAAADDGEGDFFVPSHISRGRPSSVRGGAGSNSRGAAVSEASAGKPDALAAENEDLRAQLRRVRADLAKVKAESGPASPTPTPEASKMATDLRRAQREVEDLKKKLEAANSAANPNNNNNNNSTAPSTSARSGAASAAPAPEVKALERQVAEKAAENGRLDRKLQQMQAQVDERLKPQIAELKEAKDQKEAQVRELQKTVKEQQRELQKAQQQVQQQPSARPSTQSVESPTHRRQGEQQAAALNEVKAELKEEQRKRAQLERDLKKATTEAEKANTAAEKANAVAEKAKGELEKAKAAARQPRESIDESGGGQLVRGRTGSDDFVRLRRERLDGPCANSLEAENLALSVRLADAEAVISDLQNNNVSQRRSHSTTA